MFKKIFSALCLATVILLAANQAEAYGAPKIILIVDSPTWTFSDPEKAYVEVEESLEKIFGETHPYKLVPREETEAYVQIYREEHDLITSTEAEEGKDIETYLKKKDFYNICTYFDSDYIIYARVTNTSPQNSEGFATKSKKTNVVLDFRVWSNAKKDFPYYKRVTSKGSSTAFLRGSASASRALKKGLRKGLREVEKDASKILAAMQ